MGLSAEIADRSKQQMVLTVWGRELVAAVGRCTTMVGPIRKKARVKKRALKLAQCEHESDGNFRLLALQEEEEKPAHYKLFALYEWYLEVRKMSPEKVLLEPRGGHAPQAQRAAP